jgi:hypothetical protein
MPMQRSRVIERFDCEIRSGATSDLALVEPFSNFPFIKGLHNTCRGVHRDFVCCAAVSDRFSCRLRSGVLFPLPDTCRIRCKMQFSPLPCWLSQIGLMATKSTQAMWDQVTSRQKIAFGVRLRPAEDHHAKLWLPQTTECCRSAACHSCR